MNMLIEYFNSIGATTLKKNLKVEDIQIPNIMKEFYSHIKSVELPYGRIYDIQTAIKKSKQQPFSPDWFVFGHDNYSSFWLCTTVPNKEGNLFTYWDHESGLNIEEAEWKDLLTFLKEIEEEY